MLQYFVRANASLLRHVIFSHERDVLHGRDLQRFRISSSRMQRRYIANPLEQTMTQVIKSPPLARRTLHYGFSNPCASSRSVSARKSLVLPSAILRSSSNNSEWNEFLFNSHIVSGDVSNSLIFVSFFQAGRSGFRFLQPFSTFAQSTTKCSQYHGLPSQLPAIGMSPTLPRSNWMFANPFVLLLRR